MTRSHSLFVAALALAGCIAFASAASATVNVQLSGDVTTTLTNSGQDPSAVLGRLQRDLNKGLEELGRTNPAARALFASNQTIRIVCYGSAEANNAGLNPGEGLFPAPAETRGDFNPDGSPRAGGITIIAINCDQLRQKGLDTPVFDIDENSSLFRVLIHELLHATSRDRNHQTDDQDLYSNFVRDFLAALENKRVSALPMMGDGTVNGIRVAGGENALPQNRVFFNYNAISFMGATNTVATLGFERTFLDGNASIGVRLPFLGGPGGIDLGDITIIGKYAFVNDGNTGNALSAGLAVTIQGGGGPTVFQPFVGGQTERRGFTIQAFSSLFDAVGPGNTAVMSSVGVGYPIDLAGGNRVSTVVPTAELHLTKPLSIPGFELNLTVGAEFLLRGGASAYVGVTVPLGPFQPYDFRVAVGVEMPLDFVAARITDLVADLRQR